jgi:hypothetical protein
MGVSKSLYGISVDRRHQIQQQLVSRDDINFDTQLPLPQVL